MSAQLAPTTIISPERMKIEKSMLERAEQPAAHREHEPGHEAEAGAVRAIRSASAEPLRDRDHAQHESETPKPSVIAFFAWIPETMRSAPSPITAAPSSHRLRVSAWAGGSGRLRIADTMFIRLTRHADAVTTTNVSSTPSA